jgi:peptidoglycan hydrolase CwlO-like protein
MSTAADDPVSYAQIHEYLEEIRQGQRRIEERVEHADIVVGAVDQRVGAVDQRIGGIDRRLSALEKDIKSIREDIALIKKAVINS